MNSYRAVFPSSVKEKLILVAQVGSRPRRNART
jgi:hypothetical protein